jgi:hypothetical protein
MIFDGRARPAAGRCSSVAILLPARLPKAAIAKYLFVSESTLRRWLARVLAA